MIFPKPRAAQYGPECYRLLWRRRNYEKGMEIFLEQLENHRKALADYPAEA